MRDFDGKIVLVTGASTGLGAALAVGAAARGAKAVIINYAKSKAEAEATAEAVRAAGAEAVLAQGDVSENDDCINIAEAAAKFGRIDALANNAGTTKQVPNHANLDGLTREDFERIYAVNVIGAYQMVRALVPLIERSGGGAIVNVSSIASMMGTGSSLAYMASKGALNALSVGLARSLAPQIRVNAIAPGLVETPWMEKGLGAGRYAATVAGYRGRAALDAVITPEDVAEAAWFLGVAAAKTTGEVLLLDAGLRLRRD